MATVSLQVRRLLMIVAVTLVLLAMTAAPAMAGPVNINVKANVINNDVCVCGNTITVNV